MLDRARVKPLALLPLAQAIVAAGAMGFKIE
jgi:hypothetical protein